MNAPLLLALSLVVLPAQTAPEPMPDDASELLGALLSGLLGFREVSAPELQDEIAQVGGVPFKSQVAVDYLSRDQLAGYLASMFDEEYPPAEAEADRRTLLALDLIPPATDLRALRNRVLRENVVGFYDERPAKKRLCLVSEDRRLTPMNQIVLSHELRHALQDQYLDLHDLLPRAIGDYDDRRLAFMSLVEGDATFVMERFLAGRLSGEAGGGAMGGGAQAVLPSLFGIGSEAAAGIQGAPPVVSEQLVLPYFAGRDLMATLFRDGGWEAVKTAWAHPPASTEQVLHPEKYRANEAPRKVEPSLTPHDGRLLRDGVLGEALIRTLLGEGSEEAAAGWGGDAYRVFDLAGRTLLSWRSEWDSARDTQEFLAATRARFTRACGPPAESGGFSVFVRDPWRFAVGERAGGVELVSSDDAASFGIALRALGSGAHRGPSGRRR